MLGGAVTWVAHLVRTMDGAGGSSILRRRVVGDSLTGWSFSVTVREDRFGGLTRCGGRRTASVALCRGREDGSLDT